MNYMCTCSWRSNFFMHCSRFHRFWRICISVRLCERSRFLTRWVSLVKYSLNISSPFDAGGSNPLFEILKEVIEILIALGMVVQLLVNSRKITLYKGGISNRNEDTGKDGSVELLSSLVSPSSLICSEILEIRNPFDGCLSRVPE